MNLRELKPLLVEDDPIDIIHEGYDDAGIYLSREDIPESLLDGEVIEIFACNRYEDECCCDVPMFQPVQCIVIKGCEED